MKPITGVIIFIIMVLIGIIGALMSESRKLIDVTTDRVMTEAPWEDRGCIY